MNKKIYKKNTIKLKLDYRCSVYKNAVHWVVVPPSYKATSTKGRPSYQARWTEKIKYY
jgi:hypothetical protein